MRVEWHGQSAFQLRSQSASVFIDPFGDLTPMRERGIRFDYPEIQGVEADLLLITHEHLDHNAAEVIGGDPVVIRSTAGKIDSPLGEVLAVASEHDDAAGTQRGPNTIFVFTLDGVRVCHFGDFGQAALRQAQATAIGEVDLLILPVGGGPTIGAQEALELVGQIAPSWVVPMHYRTPKVGFLETAEDFLAGFEQVLRLPQASFETSELPAQPTTPLAVVPAAP